MRLAGVKVDCVTDNVKIWGGDEDLILTPDGLSLEFLLHSNVYPVMYMYNVFNQRLE